MRSITRTVGGGLVTLLSILALSACGGGGSSSAPVSVAPPVQQPAAITGIETPSSISVVTATNAN
jgi:hypothetical protein